jgi:hypothetical protein
VNQWIDSSLRHLPHEPFLSQGVGLLANLRFGYLESDITKDVSCPCAVYVLLKEASNLWAAATIGRETGSQCIARMEQRYEMYFEVL